MKKPFKTISNWDETIDNIYAIQNFPRWDEYASKFQDNYASRSFRVAATGLLLGLLEKHQYRNEIDILTVMGKGLFGDLKIKKTGPFKYKTKCDPLVRDLIKKIQKEASKEILNLLPKEMIPVFRPFFVNAKGDGTREGDLVYLASKIDALLFCKREIKNSWNVTNYQSLLKKNNESYREFIIKSYQEILDMMNTEERKEKYDAKSLNPQVAAYQTLVKEVETKLKGMLDDHFPIENVSDYLHENVHQTSFEKAYQDVLKEIKDKLEETPFDSVSWLLQQIEQETEVYQFFLSIMNLDTVRRWKGKYSTIYDDDAIHTFRASCLAMLHGYYEKIYHNEDIDMEKLMARMLLHDLSEEWGGDVLGPVKHSSPEMKQAFEEYEKAISSQMASLLPISIQTFVEDYMVNAKEDDYEGYLVDMNDKIDALMKANMERHINARVYEKDYMLSYTKLKNKFSNPSALLFIDMLENNM